jgi:hypothetical protein
LIDLAADLVETEAEYQETEPEETSDMEQQVQIQDQVIQSLRKQIISMATDINRKHNEQQSQLQGVEAVSRLSNLLVG